VMAPGRELYCEQAATTIIMASNGNVRRIWEVKRSVTKLMDGMFVFVPGLQT